jgi:RimJ/RimL family protein N-acetyltransferase
MGGAIFTDWNQGSVIIHFALFGPRGGLGKQLLWLVFQYPFNQLGVKKLFGLIPEWNIVSRNTALKFGFRIEYKIDDVFNNPAPVDNGLYIMSMTREQCKWLRMKPPNIEFAPVGQTSVVPGSILDNTVQVTLH